MDKKYALVLIDANKDCTVEIFDIEKDAIYAMNEKIDELSDKTDCQCGYLPTVKIENRYYKRLIYAADPFLYSEYNNQTDPEEDSFYVVEITEKQEE